MKYIIRYMNKADEHKPVILTSYAAVMADDKAAAMAAFEAENPTRRALDAEPATENAFARYGDGSLTEEEKAERRAGMQRRAEIRRREHEEAKEAARTFEPDEFAAVVEYRARRESETTPNLDGVHVGDLLSCSWGWEQTNVDFWQVVGLRGKHTMIIRKLNAVRVDYAGFCGVSRPIRNSFESEIRRTVRTAGGAHLIAKCPDHDGHYLRPAKDGELFEYTTYA